MKNHTLILLFFFLILISGCTKTAEEASPLEGTFTALTYNVAGLPEGINADQHPVANTPLISPRLNNYDLVNVQEDFYYHDVLIKDNHHKYKTKYFALEGGLGDGLNMFSDFLILNFMRTGWDDCHGTDCLTPKGFTYSRVKLTPKAYIDVYDLHCNAGSDSADLAARRANIIQLCKYIKFRSKDHAVIIMGDTNCRYTREGDNIRELLALGFKDSWIELEKGGVLPEQNGVTLADEVVDKIFYRSNSSISLTALEYDVPGDAFLDGNGEWLSDHRPVFTKFKFNVLN